MDVNEFIPVIENEVVLPSQLDGGAKNSSASGERALWGAVLREAVDTARGDTKIGRRALQYTVPGEATVALHGYWAKRQTEAIDWLRTIDYAVGGFDWLCELFGWEPAWVRGKTGLELELREAREMSATRDKVIAAIETFGIREFVLADLRAKSSLADIQTEALRYHVEGLVTLGRLVLIKRGGAGGVASVYAVKQNQMVARDSTSALERPPAPDSDRQVITSPSAKTGPAAKLSELRMCTECQTSKPPSEFYNRNDRPNGLQGRCKECSKTSSKKRSRIARVLENVVCPNCDGRFDHAKSYADVTTAFDVPGAPDGAHFETVYACLTCARTYVLTRLLFEVRPRAKGEATLRSVS